MRTKLEKVKEQYLNLRDEINEIKSDGNLSKLFNLRSEFDNSLDQFFDDKDLRQKYNAWNNEEDGINTDINNSELEEMLDDEDINMLIKFYKTSIDILEEEKSELIEQNR